MYYYLLYPLFIVAILISAYAQFKVSTTFRKYSRVATASGRTAAQVAREILDRNGLRNVGIERVGGHLSDHYDPGANVLRLSDSVYSSPSAAAIGVAAHEAGHAIQHAEDYLPIRVRSRLVPITNFASRASWIFIFLGILLYGLSVLGDWVLLIGVGLFAVTTLFQLVTLPCEFNASRRALSAMDGMGYFSRRELSDAKRVLSAAAMTYVAALIVSILQLLRYLTLLNRRRR